MAFMAPLKMIFFDLDGTIADTERMALGVLSEYFKGLGHPLSADDLEALVGHPWSDVVVRLQKKYRLKATPADLEKALLVRYRDCLSREVPEIPGSVAAVKSLATAFRMCVVSGSHRDDITTVLTTLKIESCFERYLGFEDYPQGKPSPAPYLEAMKVCGVRPDEAVVFEDSTPGVQSGIAAGLRVVTIGPSVPPHHHRPKTPWGIDDFKTVNVAWMKERF